MSQAQGGGGAGGGSGGGAGSGHPPPPAHTAVLKELRQRLDQIDLDMVNLVAKRMETVRAVVKEKSAHATGGIRDAQREHELLARVETLARGVGVSAPLVRKIYAEILAHSVSRQASTLTGLETDGDGTPLAVAYVGSPFTFNHLAAQKFAAEWGQNTAVFTGYPAIKDAVAALNSEEADLILLNIESTAAGSINQVYELLREKDLHIIGEEIIKVDLCLCGVAEVPLTAIDRVMSHPLALEQCSIFLEALPRAKPVPFVDTALALRQVAEAKDPTLVAIGSVEGAAASGLTVIRRGIGNHEEILHRYVALARAPMTFDARIPCRTSLILSTRHEQGALLGCLEVLGDHGLSLTKLESRPHPDRPWEYMFFIDFEGNTSDPRVGAALVDLRARTLFLKVLGCYPTKARAEDAHLPRPESVGRVTRASAVHQVVVDEKGAFGAARAAAAGDLVVTALPVGSTSPPPAVVLPAPAARSETRSKTAPRRHRLVDRAAQSKDTLVRVGNLLIGGQGFVVAAGPGAVESEAQINDTARYVRDHGAHLLRGGAMRTKDGDGFVGLGMPGLEMLEAAGRALGMPVVTEVTTPEDVRPVAERADILQVGARNMQNYALLRELGRVNRPVLLKRGLSATIDEWLAAADFVLSEGNGQVILCERGIRTFENATASTLDLSAVVVLKERTHLPIMVDPSHGTGRRRYVAPMAWAARACGAHGLLIEVHPDPDNALTDAPESLDFPAFAALMQGLARWST
jgi:chorismate mutase / prephenate dehydratase